jgi:peptidoglycan biosynthesis protein MviN/MurJ (putative lipid II flippase)
MAVAGIGFALYFREPAIRLLFERGEFTGMSTRLTAAVFLGLGPSVIGWSLIEITSRSLFALDRRWPQVVAVAVPLLINVAITLRLRTAQPELLGVGASIGLMAGFVVLFTLLHTGRKRWL